MYRVRPTRVVFVTAAALVLAACSEPAPEPEAPAQARNRKHALFIVVDTLRRDALDHADTPNLDRLRDLGEMATLAWSSDTWTGGSVVSLFTGSSVREHGWKQSFPGRKSQRWEGLPPLPALPTLAEVLSDEGFATAGYYANRVLSWKLGWRRGFDRWVFSPDAKIPGYAALELRGWNDGRRHFLYLHFMAPHAPLDPSPQARARWHLRPGGKFDHDASTHARKASATSAYRRAYWATLEDVDRRIGAMLPFLEPYLDETVVVFTADHGEMLGEKNVFGHGRWMYEPLTRIPFIAVNADQPLPERLNNAVAADLITRALGVEHEWSLRLGEPAPLVSQHRQQFAISLDGRTKAIWGRFGRLTLFDLAGYPQEQPRFAEEREALVAARESFERETTPGRANGSLVEPDAELLESLQALGYVGGEEEAAD